MVMLLPLVEAPLAVFAPFPAFALVVLACSLTLVGKSPWLLRELTASDWLEASI